MLLRLRRLTEDECRAIADADREGQDWADDYPTAADVLRARLRLEGGEVGSQFSWLQVVDIHSQLAIGGAGFNSAPVDGILECGFSICDSYQGVGAATEVVDQLVQRARNLGATTLIARTAMNNGASQRVLSKAGFQVVAEDSVELTWSLEL